MAKVSFIGLGVMGYPMAGHLQKAGHHVKVYNRTKSVAEKWLSEYQGEFCATPQNAAQGSEYVFVCVGNDDDLRSVIYDDTGVLAGLAEKALLVDHTSASPSLAREVSRDVTNQSSVFFDAPVSGGEQGAVNGQLTIMCGGPEDQFTQLQEVINCYAKFSQLMGQAGAGQTAKVVNQICIGGLVQSLSEGLLFAESAGLDIDKLIETISKGAAGSWQMENRYKTMSKNEYEHGFAVNWMRKDLDIAKREAAELNLELPFVDLIDEYYSQVQDMGGSRWDTSSLLARLKKINSEP